MTENFDINTKFYSYEGILGRRDYCLNIIYITAISLIINSPFIIYLLYKCSSLEDIFRFNAIFINAPIILKLLAFAGASATVALLVPTIHRRVRDLCAGTNNYWTAICSIFLGATYFGFLFPLQSTLAVFCTANIIGLCLLFVPGKITSNLPYDYTKEFNWGAYFGTWMWGLYNRSYITLFSWALYATPFSGLFKIYCGLKGNEWAFKGKKWNDVKAFNKSQKRQTIFFICLNFLILPALFIVPIVILIAIIAASCCGSCSNGTSVDKVTPPPAIEQKIEQNKTGEKIELKGFAKSMANIYFDSYELTDEEYRFYVSEKDWKSYTIFDKLDLMNTANKIMKGSRCKNGCGYRTNSDAIEKIKLYSTEKHQLLGEFNKDIDFDNASAKDIFKNMFNMFKFYEVEK